MRQGKYEILKMRVEFQKMRFQKYEIKNL